MRRIAQFFLLVFAFAVPWEYSLDWGDPVGNIARIAGLLLLIAAVPAVLQAGEFRRPGVVQWLVLAYLLWFCCSCLWSIDSAASLVRLRGYFQEAMIVWLAWEFAGSRTDLRMLLRAFVAGSWMLALLSLNSFGSAEAVAADQIRFAAEGQDPNDVARFLDLGFPLAALLFDGDEKRWGRLLGAGYFPLGLLAVLLTASRGGFIALLAALAGSSLILFRKHRKRLVAGAFLAPLFFLVAWTAVPQGTFERLGTIYEQLHTGDLNQRVNIWSAGWQAFVQASMVGRGAGSFVAAAGLAPVDTAHNTVLSIAVSGGLCGLFFACAILAATAWSVLRTRGSMRLALGTAVAVWCVSTLVAAVEENRATWLLIAIVAVAGRLAGQEPVAVSLEIDPAHACVEASLNLTHAQQPVAEL